MTHNGQMTKDNGPSVVFPPVGASLRIANLLGALSRNSAALRRINNLRPASFWLAQPPEGWSCALKKPGVTEVDTSSGVSFQEPLALRGSQ